MSWNGSVISTTLPSCQDWQGTAAAELLSSASGLNNPLQVLMFRPRMLPNGARVLAKSLASTPTAQILPAAQESAQLSAYGIQAQVCAHVCPSEAAASLRASKSCRLHASFQMSTHSQSGSTRSGATARDLLPSWKAWNAGSWVQKASSLGLEISQPGNTMSQFLADLNCPVRQCTFSSCCRCSISDRGLQRLQQVWWMVMNGYEVCMTGMACNSCTCCRDESGGGMEQGRQRAVRPMQPCMHQLQMLPGQ